MEEKRIIQAKCNEFVHFSNQIKTNLFFKLEKLISFLGMRKKTFPKEVVGCFDHAFKKHVSLMSIFTMV